MAEKKEEAAAPAAAPKSKKKLLIIIIAAVVILGGAGGFFLLGGKKAEEKAEEHTEEKPPDLRLAKLEAFIVNLSESKSFLRCTLLLEYDANILATVGGAAEGEGHAGGEHGGGGEGGGSDDALPALLKPKEPILRDAILRVMSSKKIDDVLTTDGKDRLKSEIIEAANQALGFEEAPITNVYFTEFVVQ